jgi:DNA-binding Lrp family transcriptional regulator
MNRQSAFDMLDYQIIQELRRDSRVDAAKIARTIGAGERTVRNRIDRLIALDAIRPAIIINPKTFGYGVMVEVLLEVEPKYEGSVVKQLLGLPEITYAAYGQNDQDLVVQARFKDLAEMREFVKRTLPAIRGVSVMSSALVPRVLRDVDSWVPRAEDFGVELRAEVAV